MRVIILADGKAERWTGEVPKHLLQINGEILLHRTVRQLIGKGISDIWITSHDPRYNIPGITMFNPENNKYKIDQFYACSSIWREHSPVVFLYGDVYFSNNAIGTILESVTDEYLYFQRTGPSKITGKPWKEGFAMKVSDTESFFEALTTIRELIVAGQAGVAHHQVQGFLEGHGTGAYWGIGPHGIEIDDETDDFDFPEDVERWLSMVGHIEHNQAGRPAPRK